jgi:hypothetical protein
VASATTEELYDKIDEYREFIEYFEDSWEPKPGVWLSIPGFFSNLKYY